MIGLTILEIYFSIFNINSTYNKFEFYTYNFDKFSFEELKDELEEVLNISNITSEHLQDDIIGPRIISTYKILETEKRQTDGYYMLILGFARSPFRDFESYPRIVVGLDEDDIQLILKQHHSNFVIYDLSPRIFTIKDISEAVDTMGDHERTPKVEYDDIDMKTKLLLTRFGGTFGTLRFDKKCFSNTLRAFTPYWVYKPTNAIHADSSDVYTSDNVLNLSTIDKVCLKCDIIDGSVVNGMRELILFSFF